MIDESGMIYWFFISLQNDYLLKALFITYIPDRLDDPGMERSNNGFPDITLFTDHEFSLRYSASYLASLPPYPAYRFIRRHFLLCFLSRRWPRRCVTWLVSCGVNKHLVGGLRILFFCEAVVGRSRSGEGGGFLSSNQSSLLAVAVVSPDGVRPLDQIRSIMANLILVSFLSLSPSCCCYYCCCCQWSWISFLAPAALAPSESSFMQLTAPLTFRLRVCQDVYAWQAFFAKPTSQSSG